MTYASDVAEEDAVKEGVSVSYNGDLAAYYLEDGFDVYNAFSPISRGNYKLAHRIALIIGLLNRDKKIEHLFEYMDELCKERYDTDVFKVNRTHLLNALKNSMSGLYDVTPDVKKYFWVGKYKHANKTVKSSVVLSNHNKNRATETFNSVNSAVQSLIEQGNKDNTFITISDIVEVSGISKPTVYSIIGLFREQIDKYNYSNFETDNYPEFIKLSNIGSIVGVIERFIDNLETKLTQRKVANNANLHYNTVNNLWFERDVQESLDKYNKWRRSVIIKK